MHVLNITVVLVQNTQFKQLHVCALDEVLNKIKEKHLFLYCENDVTISNITTVAKEDSIKVGEIDEVWCDPSDQTKILANFKITHPTLKELLLAQLNTPTAVSISTRTLH